MRRGSPDSEPNSRGNPRDEGSTQLEGALLLARTYKSLEPMRRAERAVKLLVRIGQPERS